MRRSQTRTETRARLIAVLFVVPALTLLLIPWVEYNKKGTVNIPCITGGVAIIAIYITYFLTPSPHKRTAYIHPEFRIVEGSWFQNYGVGPILPDVKITFVFDDVNLLDGCPFLCKIACHADPTRAKYFGVVYARSSELPQVKAWTARFRCWEVRTPEAGSRLLEVLD